MADVEQNFGSGLLGYVMLMDPSTGKPYRATNIVQQTDGDFNTEGLATADMQQQELAVLNALSTKLSAPLTVEVDNAEMPLPAGAATDAKQDSMITALGNLAALLGGTLSVSVGGQPLEAQITTSALPTGASTAAKQAEVKTALDAVLTALAGVLQVSGDVNVSSDEPLTVEGTVHMDNTTFSVTPSGTFNVSVTGGATSDKQDALIGVLQDVLTRLSNPLSVSDGGQSVTVDGVVGVSGTVPVSQSGTWTMQTTPGASATSSALTSFRSGTVSTSAQAIKTSSGRVYQYTFFNPNSVTVYVHFYDAAVGNVSTPKMSFAVPAGSTLDGYWSISHGFSTAISISASTNWDATGTPASTMQVTVGYA